MEEGRRDSIVLACGSIVGIACRFTVDEWEEALRELSARLRPEYLGWMRAVCALRRLMDEAP